MATKLYLRDGAATNDPGETNRSVALPDGADVFQDYGIAVKSLSTTIGTSEVEVTGSSTVNTVETAEFFTSFSSEALLTSITAETWTIAVDVSEGNAAANSLMIPIVYVFREPSTVVGFVIDAHTAIGNEWAAAVAAGRVATFSGAAVTVEAGDYLVLEFWRHTAAQAMAMAYTQTLAYDGTVDVTEDSTTSAASYLETPQNGLFAVRRIFIS
ncbi:hypothetical protein LCGC14_1740580 [marine sediment metagenome]|uniref:Uncharacterized protein n=1 Tax=marine sediment metagenome TaxID=412755 RepID=A0A0F9H6X8_9ZZZZ